METTEWAARARREAAAIVEGANPVIPASRDSLIELMALAWVEGRIGGIHQALSVGERAHLRLQEDLR